MKHYISYILQKILGFNNYLFFFSIFGIKTIRINPSEGEFVHFVDIIRDEGIILDIGANIGITTVPIAKAKRNSIVYSFEPMPDNINALKRIIHFFNLKNVEVFETALGDYNGTVQMLMPVVKKAKMQGFSHVASQEEKVADQISVPIKKLDDINELISADKISAIKIDVENFEYFVLKGAENILKKHRPLIYCELWEDDRKTMTIDYLKRLGYEIKIFNDGGLIEPNDPTRVNFFFIPVS